MPQATLESFWTSPSHCWSHTNFSIWKEIEIIHGIFPVFPKQKPWFLQSLISVNYMYIQWKVPSFQNFGQRFIHNTSPSQMRITWITGVLIGPRLLSTKQLLWTNIYGGVDLSIPSNLCSSLAFLLFDIRIGSSESGASRQSRLGRKCSWSLVWLAITVSFGLWVDFHRLGC